MESTRITIRAIASPRVNLFISFILQNLFNTFFAAASGQHQFMSAATAFQFDIHTHPEDRPDLTAAGMGLFHFYFLIQFQIHFVSPLLISGEYLSYFSQRFCVSGIE